MVRQRFAVLRQVNTLSSSRPALAKLIQLSAAGLAHSMALDVTHFSDAVVNLWNLRVGSYSVFGFCNHVGGTWSAPKWLRAAPNRADATDERTLDHGLG